VEALIEMYLAGVSVRRVEDITQALWGTRVSASTVSELNQKIYKQIEEWRQQPLVGDFRYVFLDGLWLKRSWGGEVKNVSVMVAIGVAQSGYRQILAVSEGAKEDKASWAEFLRGWKDRGLKGVELFVSDKAWGWWRTSRTSTPKRSGSAAWCISTATCGQQFLQARYGRWRRYSRPSTLRKTPKRLKEKARLVVEKLRAMKLAKAAEIVENGIGETLSAARALALSAHQQPTGTTDARDTPTNARCRGLPRRQLGLDAGRRTAQACGLHPMGNQTLSPDGPLGRGRRYRLTFFALVPHGDKSKSTPTQQPSKELNQNESAKDSGHYHLRR
jgi:hypothetical protein